MSWNWSKRTWRFKQNQTGTCTNFKWRTWRGNKNSSTVVWEWECYCGKCPPPVLQGTALWSSSLLYESYKKHSGRIPHHISDIDRLIKLKELLAVQLNKEKKHGIDYCKTVIYLTIAPYQTTTHDVRALLATLYEMAEIFLMCWRHAILCWKVMTQLQPQQAESSFAYTSMYVYLILLFFSVLLQTVQLTQNWLRIYESHIFELRIKTLMKVILAVMCTT